MTIATRVCANCGADGELNEAMTSSAFLCHPCWEADAKGYEPAKAGDPVVAEYERLRQEDARLDGTSDAQLARFIKPLWEGRFLFDHADGSWFAARGGQWQRMADHSMRGLLQDIALHVPNDVQRDDKERAGYLTAMRSNRKAEAVLTSLSSMQGMSFSGEWDGEPYLLGTPKGVIDLRTGRYVEPDDSTHVRRRTTVSPFPMDLVPGRDDDVLRDFYGIRPGDPGYPSGDPTRADFMGCPKFLTATHLMLPDQDVWRYVMRALGWILTGETEQFWLFAHGLGSNGKTFLAELMRLLMGDAERGGYVYSGKPDTFVVAKHENPINLGSAMNAMRGSRLIIVPEISHGILHTERMKTLSGGDTMTYRAPYGRGDVSYKPSATILMHGNSRPTITDSTYGNWRRLLEIPFRVRIADVVPKLIKNYWEEVYREEGPAILTLLVAAAVEYYRDGLLPVPQAVTDATEEYRVSADPFANWLREKTSTDKMGATQASRLWASYIEWCDHNHERSLGSNLFYGRLAERDFVKEERRDGNYYLGVTLKAADDPEHKSPIRDSSAE